MPLLEAELMIDIHLLISIIGRSIPTSPLKNIHSSHTNQTNPIHSTRSKTQIAKQNYYALTSIEREPHVNQSLSQTSDVQELKNLKKWIIC
jgi:hypothetical protein